ncbi:SGNH/GDSL hydrolase family protein [Amnibacterium endophyticum]|uniref:SGNH/GDSL hydrolase family protein n=1 Tax=Amnibacterium endophyticum TaxID=2109337 RepID=A0ABW4LFL1_9MICO
MSSSRPRRLTRRAGLAAAAGLLAGAGAVAARPAGPAVDSAAAAVLPPAPADGMRGPSMFVLGDSWAAGLHADPDDALGQVAARVLRSSVRVDAISGTGYLNPAGARTYPDRAAAAHGDEQLVVVQGGSNDGSQDLDALAGAVRETVARLQSGFPGAALVLLGPGPDPLPVTSGQRRVDEIIAGAAKAIGVPYVSMLQQDWIPEDRADAVIDPATAHPTPQGQEYLGIRLAAALHLVVPEVVSA